MDGLTGQLYGEPTKWEVGKIVSIPEEKRMKLNRGLFFTPTLTHAISRGAGVRAAIPRVPSEDQDRERQAYEHLRSYVPQGDRGLGGEVIDEVKNPVEVLFDMV